MTKTRTSKGKSLTELILILFPLHRRILEAGDSLSAEVGLTSALWQVLGALEAKPRSVAQIGRDMGLTRQSVQRSVNILASDGLVEFVPNPDHKTSPLVKKTATGDLAYQKVTQLQISWSNNIAAEMKHQELLAAVNVLNSFLDQLETEK